MQHQILFETSLFTFKTDLPQKVNDQLQEALLKMEKTDKPIDAKSNAGGWHSNLLNNKEDLCFQILHNYLDLCFLKIIKTLTNKEQCSFKRSSWAIINKKDDYNMAHSHANSDWSCVYYVNSGNHYKNPKNKAEKYSGNLVFTDPRGSLILNSRTIPDKDALYEKLFGSNYMSLTPTTGLLVFFPSWLISFLHF